MQYSYFHFVVLIACLPSIVYAQDNESRSRSLMSCVLNKNLTSGKSVTFRVKETKPSHEQQAKRVAAVVQSISMAIVPISGSDELAWLEIALRKQNDDSPTWIIKNLVKLKLKDAKAEDWLAEQTPLGWMQTQGKEIVQINEDSVQKIPWFALLFKKREMKVTRNVEVATKLGKYKCEKHEFRPKGMPQATVSCHLNSRVGFGCAKLTLVSVEQGGEYRAELTVNSVGSDAKTQMPNKTLQSAFKEFRMAPDSQPELAK